MGAEMIPLVVNDRIPVNLTIPIPHRATKFPLTRRDRCALFERMNGFIHFNPVTTNPLPDLPNDALMHTEVPYAGPAFCANLCTKYAECNFAVYYEFRCSLYADIIHNAKAHAGSEAIFFTRL